MNRPVNVFENSSLQILTVNSLLDEWDNRQLLNSLQQRINEGVNQFIIDLSDLTIINSVGLNFLLNLLSKVQLSGGQLLLANASAHVMRLLDITKLASIFELKDSVAEAIEELEEEILFV